MTESLYNAYLYDSPVLGKLAALPGNSQRSSPSASQHAARSLAAPSPQSQHQPALRHESPTTPASVANHPAPARSPDDDRPPPAPIVEHPAPITMPDAPQTHIIEDSPLDLPLPSDLEWQAPPQSTPPPSNAQSDDRSASGSSIAKASPQETHSYDRKGSNNSASTLLPKRKPAKRRQPRAVHEMSRMTRLSYVNLLLLPLLVALGILAATSVPSDYYRSRLSVTRMSIPRGKWNENISDEDDKPQLDVNAGGALTTSMWGWCWLPEEDDAKPHCSPPTPWYTMGSFFTQAGASSSKLSLASFGAQYTHALVTHIIAFGLAVLAVLCMTWHVYARYGVNDSRVDATWMQHYSCLFAFLATLTTYIIDIIYEKSVSKKAPASWKPEQGSIPIFTLISFLLLLLGFFCSILPVFFGYLHRQAAYGSYESNDIFQERGLEDDSDDEADYDRRDRRRQSLWQKGLNRVRPYSLVRTRQHHQGLGRGGATRELDRPGYDSEYSLDFADESKTRRGGRRGQGHDYY